VTCRVCCACAVSTAVHDQLGGVVEHRGIDSTDLPDESKLLQRLYSLNVMRLEGHEPDTEVWTVRPALQTAAVAAGRLQLCMCSTGQLDNRWLQTAATCAANLDACGCPAC
jgi:hypothetical protein